MLDLHRLEILQRFAARGSIVAAAADLGYSPSAVSQQLATLEREAGLPLIERTAHSASLTDAGRELAQHAGAVLAAAEAAESRMRARAGTVSGSVTVSCIPGLAIDLAPYLADLQRRHDGLTIVANQTESTRAVQALLDRSCDVAVVDDWTEEPMAAPAGLVVHRLHREQVVLAVPQDLPGVPDDDTALSPAAMRALVERETWLAAPVGQLSRVAGDERLDRIGATPPHRWEFDGLHVRARLVANGAGLTLLPLAMARAEPGVRTLGLRPRMHRYVHLIARRTAERDPAVRACLEAAREALQPAR